jgi:hypothetical protein
MEAAPRDSSKVRRCLHTFVSSLFTYSFDLHSDDNPDSRFREYLLEQAKDQIRTSGHERRAKV